MAYNNTANVSIEANSTAGDSNLSFRIISQVLASPEATSISLRAEAEQVIDLSESLTRAFPETPGSTERKVQYIAIKGDALFDVSLSAEAGVDIFSGVSSTTYIRLFSSAGVNIPHLKVKAGLTPVKFTALVGHG